MICRVLSPWTTMPAPPGTGNKPTVRVPAIHLLGLPFTNMGGCDPGDRVPLCVVHCDTDAAGLAKLHGDPAHGPAAVLYQEGGELQPTTAAEHAALAGYLRAHGASDQELTAAALAAVGGRTRHEIDLAVTAFLNSKRGK